MASLEAILVSPIPTPRVNQVTVLGRGADTATTVAGQRRAAALGLALVINKRQHLRARGVRDIRQTRAEALRILGEIRRHVDAIVAADGLRRKPVAEIIHEALRLAHRRRKRLVHRARVGSQAVLHALLERAATPVQTVMLANVVHALLQETATTHTGSGKALPRALGPVGHAHEHRQVGQKQEDQHTDQIHSTGRHLSIKCV